MAAKNTIKVLIDGKIVTLSGYESEEYLQRVASYLNNKITELSMLPGYNRQSPDTRSTLLALNIADDYFKAKDQADAMEDDMESKDREAYDVKHDLIAAQIQIDKMKQEFEQMQKERDSLKLQVEKLNTELEDLLK
ncbi:MAG TPA: cell division protein ZapA [Candidatus Scatomonas merdavium]|nr:cell division protein ZapA [Candidatus Scatomonas merdavium]